MDGFPKLLGQQGLHLLTNRLVGKKEPNKNHEQHKEGHQRNQRDSQPFENLFLHGVAYVGLNIW